MKTKEFQCTPYQAKVDFEGLWRIYTLVKTDNSRHCATHNMGPHGTTTYGKYKYTPEQKHYVIGVSEAYQKNCLSTLTKFRLVHNLAAHKAKETDVKFDENAKIIELKEEFWDGD